MTEEKWGTVQVAREYYGVSLNTLYNWRRKKKVKSRQVEGTMKVSFEYVLDPELKKTIEVMKTFDNRWS